MVSISTEELLGRLDELVGERVDVQTGWINAGGSVLLTSAQMSGMLRVGAKAALLGEQRVEFFVDGGQEHGDVPRIVVWPDVAAASMLDPAPRGYRCVLTVHMGPAVLRVAAREASS